LYGSSQARATFRINLMKGPVLLITVLMGTWWWGSTGAAFALAFTEIAVLPAWLVTLHRFQRTRDSTISIPRDQPRGRRQETATARE